MEKKRKGRAHHVIIIRHGGGGFSGSVSPVFLDDVMADRSSRIESCVYLLSAQIHSNAAELIGLMELHSTDE